jgi:hypothetical protein
MSSGRRMVEQVIKASLMLLEEIEARRRVETRKALPGAEA